MEENINNSSEKQISELEFDKYLEVSVNCFLEYQKLPSVKPIENKPKKINMNYIEVEQMNDACDKIYSEDYSHGGYCHEQSFRFGFQEGIEFVEREFIDRLKEYLYNCTMLRDDEIEQAIDVTKQSIEFNFERRIDLLEKEKQEKFVEYCFKESIKDDTANWDYYRFDYSGSLSPELIIDYHIWKSFDDSPRKDYIGKVMHLSNEEIRKLWEIYKNSGS